MKKFLLTVAAAAFLASCGPVMKSRTAIRTVHIEKEAIVQYPMVAEIEVDTKSPIVYTTETKMKSKFGDQSDMFKQLILREAAKANNAHVVVDPVFNFERIKGKKFRVTVDGFKGMYKNIRTANIQDIEVIERANDYMIFKVNESNETEMEAYGRRKNKVGRRAKN